MHSCALDNLSCLSNTVLSAVRSQSRALAPMFSTAPEARRVSAEEEMLNRANLREEEPEFKHRMLRCDIGSSGRRVIGSSEDAERMRTRKCSPVQNTTSLLS